MINKHPIDDLFRKGLAQAEVAPPAAVWEGIVAQQSWSNRLLKSVRKYWWVPLLFLAFTGAGIGAAVSSDSIVESKHEKGDASTQPQGLLASSNTSSSTGHSTNSHNTNSTQSSGNGFSGSSSSTSSAEVGETIPSGQSGAAGFPTSPKEPKPGNENQQMQNGSAISSITDKAIPTNNNTSNLSDKNKDLKTSAYESGHPNSILGITKNNELQERNASVSDALGNRRLSSFIDATAELMDIRDTKYVRGDVQRLGARGKGKFNATAGSIPPGDWWVGGSIGYNMLNTNYSGTPNSLEDALNKGEEGHHEISFDMLGGRSWRSGLFVSAGLGSGSWTSKTSFNETTRTNFYADSLMQVGYDTLTQAPIYDTLAYLVGWQDSTQNYAATNRYSLVRIPLTVGWIKDIGRFELGVQGGFIFEFDAGRKGYSLISGSNASDSLLISEFSVVSSENQKLNPRYGLGISGTAGAVIGYKLNEFMSIWISPEYATRLATLSKDNIQLNADRFGMRFGVRYVLPY